MPHTDVSVYCNGWGEVDPESVGSVEQVLEKAFYDAAAHQQQRGQRMGAAERRYEAAGPHGDDSTDLILNPNADMTWEM